MKFKSKDLMESTGNKFHDLYLLSQKIDFLKPRRDKSTAEVEYELQKEECSFQPNADGIVPMNQTAVNNCNKSVTNVGGSSNMK